MPPSRAAGAAANAPAEAPEPAGTPPKSAPAADAELSAVELAGAIAAGRLKDPRTAAGLLAVVALFAFLLGRRSAG